jgi:hypothetical protein
MREVNPILPDDVTVAVAAREVLRDPSFVYFT